jgi:glucosamine kinase
MTQQHSTTLYVGIDGGGSTCRARVADSTGKVLGEGVAGSANIRLGLERSMTEIQRCVQLALTQAGLSHVPLKQLKAGVGLAGLVLQTDHHSAQPLKDLFADCELTNDAYIACLGAHHGQEGGILILGTGSCAQIISPQESRTFGGWGLTLADQASGSWLGREAIRLALLATEYMIPHSELTQYISQQFDHEPEAFLRWSLSAKPADFARYAPSIFQYAQEHDTYAKQLLQTACEDVVRYIRVLERYQTGHIALLGGLADLYSAYLPIDIQVLLSKPKGNALDGALLMARRLG